MQSGSSLQGYSGLADKMRKSKKAFLESRLTKIIVVMVIVLIVSGGLYPIAKRTFRSIMGVLGMNITSEEGYTPVEAGDYSAEIEFEENDYFVSNIHYQFRNGEWEWRAPAYSADYKKFRSVGDPVVDEESFWAADKMTIQFQGITKGLRTFRTNYTMGVKWIQLNANDDADSYLIIHYANGCTYTTPEGTRMDDLETLAKNPNKAPDYIGEKQLKC